MTEEIETKPQLPADVLNEFLEQKIRISEVKNIHDIRCGFLWDRDGLQRYRINVWTETRVDGQYCSQFRITWSFFVHYDATSGVLVDKTVEPKAEEEKVF